MTYKSKFLILFLVPCTMFGKNAVKLDKQIDVQIQDLKQKVYQKELELFNLSEKISELDKHLLAFSSEPYEILNSLIEIQANDKRRDGISLSQKDQDELANEFRDKANEFLSKFVDTLEKNAMKEGILVKNLFQKTGSPSSVEFEKFDTEDFESLKFYLIRRIFDQQLMRHLIEKYDQCVTEYSILMNELINLQKQRELL